MLVESNTHAYARKIGKNHDDSIYHGFVLFLHTLPHTARGVKVQGSSPGGRACAAFSHRLSSPLSLNRGSIIITTNLAFSEWTDLFQNTALLTALIDRLTFRSYLI
ncbi:MAG: ATP-binding protein, partial [Desulfovibrio sp.]|nr:ATP-binding protein [Desulfovibrio sp.]